MNLGLVRQERDWKINKHDMFYEYLKWFSVWGPCDCRKASRGFIPCRPATSKATRGFIPCILVSRKATRGWFPCRHGTSKVIRCQVLKIKYSHMFHIVLLYYAIVWDKFSLQNSLWEHVLFTYKGIMLYVQISTVILCLTSYQILCLSVWNIYV